MNEYVECRECGFVVLSAPATTPEPRRVDSCPDCGSPDFDFPETKRGKFTDTG